LIAEVERPGKAVTICRNRRSVLDLVPHPEVRDLHVQASHLENAVFLGDPCGPLAKGDWPATASLMLLLDTHALVFLASDRKQLTPHGKSHVRSVRRPWLDSISEWPGKTFRRGLGS
jgi:antitoxin (DNA-binding transcriptional repressor) of toxin-antitoxin stability system